MSLTEGGREAQLVITLPDVRGALRVTNQGIDLTGLDATSPMPGIYLLLDEYKRQRPAKGRPPTMPGDLDAEEIHDAIRSRRANGLEVTQLLVAVDLGVSRTTLRRAIRALGMRWRDFLDHRGPALP